MSLRRKGISGSRKGVEEEDASGAAGAASAVCHTGLEPSTGRQGPTQPATHTCGPRLGQAAGVPRMRMPGVVERGDAESAASTPRSTAEEDDAPISMRGMRLSLQASQANLLDKSKEGKADDDEDWDDD